MTSCLLLLLLLLLRLVVVVSFIIVCIIKSACASSSAACYAIVCTSFRHRQPAREAWRSHGKKRWKIAGSEVSIGKLASCGYILAHTQFNVQQVYLPWDRNKQTLLVDLSFLFQSKDRKKEERESKIDDVNTTT
jgi:hypothetical protein